MDFKQKLYYLCPSAVQNELINVERSLDHWKRDKGIDHMKLILRNTETSLGEEIEQLQLSALQNLLIYAYDHVPYYTDLLNRLKIKPESFRTLDDFQQLPCLSKADVRENYNRLISRHIKRGRVFQSHTSGTTGSPLSFLLSIEVEDLYEAAVAQHRLWNGYNQQNLIASFGGKVIVSPSEEHLPLWRYSPPDHLVIFSAFHLKSKIMRVYVDEIRRLGIRYLKGYPSNLNILATYLESIDEYLPMEKVFTGSEPLYPPVRTLLEDRFKTHIADFYGDSERSVLAYQCEYGSYHVCSLNSFVEITGKNGECLPQGQIGLVTGTNLNNYAMPLIRYRNGDVSSITALHCPCGRHGSIMSQVQTKLEDIVLTKDDRAISPSALTHPFKPIPPRAILISQLYQQQKGELMIRIVPGPEFSQLAVSQLMEGFNMRFQGLLNVSVECVSDIPRTASGKYRWVISQVKHPYNQLHNFETDIIE